MFTGTKELKTTTVALSEEDKPKDSVTTTEELAEDDE